MRRLAVLVLVVAAARPAAAAPPPAPDYYPLKVGTTWRYDGTAGDKTFQATAKVAEVETIDGEKLARVETVIGGRTVSTEHFAVTAEGVFRHRYNGAKITPPVCLLRYPVKAGEGWQTAITAGTEKATMAIRIGTGEAEVPAGKYKAVTVRIEGESGGAKLATTYWLADGVGMVKQKVDVGGVAVDLALTKFEPAK